MRTMLERHSSHLRRSTFLAPAFLWAVVLLLAACHGDVTTGVGTNDAADIPNVRFTLPAGYSDAAAGAAHRHRVRLPDDAPDQQVMPEVGVVDPNRDRQHGARGGHQRRNQQPWVRERQNRRRIRRMRTPHSGLSLGRCVRCGLRALRGTRSATGHGPTTLTEARRFGPAAAPPTAARQPTSAASPGPPARPATSAHSRARALRRPCPRRECRRRPALRTLCGQSRCSAGRSPSAPGPRRGRFRFPAACRRRP